MDSGVGGVGYSKASLSGVGGVKPKKRKIFLSLLNKNVFCCIYWTQFASGNTNTSILGVSWTSSRHFSKRLRGNYYGLAVSAAKNQQPSVTAAAAISHI